MLSWLRVLDLALVESAELSFDRGLNVLTGETGAGKSLVLGSIGLLLGDRADADWLRASAERGFVEGTFDLDGRPDLLDALRAIGVEPEEDRVIVRRELSRDGKGRAQINGRTVVLSQLRAVGEILVDLHGQHEHQRLLERDRQAEFFDGWAGLGEERIVLEQERASITRERRSLLEERARWARERGEADHIREDLAELSAAALTPGEEERLRAARDGLRHRERLLAALEETARAISGDGEGAEHDLRRAARALRTVAAALPAHQGLAEEADAALASVQDLLARVESARESLLEEAMPLEELEARLDRIHRLKRKHGVDSEGLLSLEHELSERARAWDPDGRALADRERSAAERAARYEERLDAFVHGRRERAAEFERQVGARLRRLGFQRAALAIQASEPDRARPAIDPCAIPGLEFVFRPNVGEPARPLRRIASGGELSRVMLAVKSLMAERDRVAVLVFDEVDQGIGGAAAEEVGRLLRTLAERRQVLCITHLPLIAAQGSRHFEVVKASGRGRTWTAVRPLIGKEREDEIARLLAGDRASDTTRKQARELLRILEAGAGHPDASVRGTKGER